MAPFDWGDYLALAEELAARGGDEAAQRSAISRAYYAALGRASDLLRAEGREVSPLRTHSVVWRAFKNSADSRRFTVGVNLDRLRRLRERADYAGRFDEDLSDAAREAVERAGSILRTIDDVRSGPA